MTEQQDNLLLDSLPSHLTIGGDLLKATPMEEGGRRFIYMEASNQIKDQQSEILLAKALADSADYYLKFGNLDIDHYTQIGAKRGIPDYMAYEVGVPVEVRIESDHTFVKGELKKGDGLAALKANMLWSSLTEVSPPERWYPSVGGAVIDRQIDIDPATGAKTAVITKVRWTNIGFSKTPVNDNLPTIATAAFGPMAKSWGAAMFKGLEAGYGSDSASLTGGAALRVQSLDKRLMSYWDFRDQFANAINNGEVKEMTLPGLEQVAQERFELSPEDAAKYVEQFLNDLQRALKEKR